jgi:hypothetical protein
VLRTRYIAFETEFFSPISLLCGIINVNKPVLLLLQWVPVGLSAVVKRPGLETDHSPPPSAEVKNVWNYASTPPYVFMKWCLVKHRDNFTFSCFLLTL